MRPIDADKLKESLFPSDDELIKGFCNTIDAQETLDVRPIVRGHWTTDEEDREPLYTCSACREKSLGSFHPYCPWCGAMMESEESWLRKGRH